MKRMFLLCMVVAILAVVPVASAGSALLGAYGSQSTKAVVAVKSSNEPSGPTPEAKGTQEQLPFTGVDLAVLVGAGALLTAVGLGLRKLAGEKD